MNDDCTISTEAIDEIVRHALDEDLPDITGNAIFDPDERSSARFLVKGSGVIAGLVFASAVFQRLDPNAEVSILMEDGSDVGPGDIVATASATVRALLTGERTVLNLMQRASGIATTTRAFVRAVEGTGAGIYDTRKTVPGLRAFDKYAVTAGGGHNHRLGLHDMFLVKNNHIDRAGSIARAAELVRVASHGQKVMIEVRDLRELDQALAESPDFILLDNMDNETMREAVRRTAHRIPIEASGGVTLESVGDIARTGVERISVGALTHSVVALDISMRIDPVGHS